MKRVPSFAPAFALLIGLWAATPPHSATAQIVINEVLADNLTAVDNGDDFPDYIELLNISFQTVNLGGMGLSDDATAPYKYAFPANMLLAPGGYLVVFADDKFTSPGIHTGFGLNDKGEALTLHSAPAQGGAILDGVTFGLQLPDLSIGRIPNGTGTWTLNVPTPAEPNEATPLGGPQQLSINEWMAAKNKGGVLDPDGDWFEVYNGTNLPVHLGGLFLSDSNVNHTIPGLSFIAPLGFIQFLADNAPTKGANHVSFRLSSTSGETLKIFVLNGYTNSVTFGAQTVDVSQGRLPDGAPPPYAIFPVGRDTPAASNFLLVTNVVINEVLSHTDPPLEDAVELYNPTGQPVNISGWWMSDDRSDPKRFRIPANTILPAGGLKVYHEIDFNPSLTGNPPHFSLNSFLGEEIGLYTADGPGNLTGFRIRQTFPASQNGVSFGRYITSDGDIDFVAMKNRSFGHDNPTNVLDFRLGTGLPNPGPSVGPVVINEIMYHPPDIAIGTNIVDDSDNEYIELKNISPATVQLFDPAAPTNTWHLRDAVSFDLPMNITLPAGGVLLIVHFNPATNATLLAAFRIKYGVSPTIPIYGPYKGKLSNKGDSIELLKPDPPQTTGLIGFVPYILVERVHFNDKLPWPETPDGDGVALVRLNPEGYGNDPINWIAAAPTPGIEVVRGLTLSHDGAVARIRFLAFAGNSYTVLYRNSLATGSWNKLVDVLADPVTQMRVVTDSGAGDSRFYRVVSPAQ